MLRTRHPFRPHRLPVYILLFFILAGCRVYTINKTEFESGLKKKQGKHHGLSINMLYKKQFKNSLDTVVCSDMNGALKRKRLSQDSKIRIYTKQNKSIKYYAKSLYIYKDEYLIGERTAPRLYGPNYFPVRLSEIDRIEVMSY
jgi:hypothetical protein